MDDVTQNGCSFVGTVQKLTHYSLTLTLAINTDPHCI